MIIVCSWRVLITTEKWLWGLYNFIKDGKISYKRFVDMKYDGVWRF